MNRTITTSTTHRQCLRQSLCLCHSLHHSLHHSLCQSLRKYLRLRPAALALVALPALCILLALVAASCTTDALADPDATNAAGNGNTNPDGIITFAIAPRPGFTEVPVSGAAPASAAAAPATRSIPATRAEQTDNATRWEQGDILWLEIDFFRDKKGDGTTVDAYRTSALKYDVDKWRYLTEAEAEDLNAGNLPGFTRLPRWPSGWEDWPAPVMHIAAYYTGSGKPGADGTITVNPQGEIPTTPCIVGRSELCSPDGKPVSLEFTYRELSRVRIPADCKVELTNTKYISTLTFFLDKVTAATFEPITEIPEQSEDTDVFLLLGDDATAKLTRGDISCIFPLPRITDAGNPFGGGVSYTLTAYTSGTQSPVADYDLTIATEDDLRALAQAVNAGEKLPNGKLATEARVLQTEDIELTKEWVPIGNSDDNRFRGAYNGNGNEISGLTITTAPQLDAGNRSYAGLFGYAEGAVLTGIKLRKVGINIPTGSNGDRLFAGSIAGFIENSTLSLCSADGTVNAGGSMSAVYAGGIAGYNYYSTISRCRADVETKAATTASDGAAYAGGIAGSNIGYSFILSCETQGRAVTAEGGQQALAGGITGHNNVISLIAFCHTGKNTVTARNATILNYAGGLVGQNHGYLYSCYSRATAGTPAGTGRKQAGAIAGFNNKQDRVQHCYGAGAADKGTSNLDPTGNIVYNTNPTEGEIHTLMTGYGGEVKSRDDATTGKTYYPFTTHYAPSATPAYGIIPSAQCGRRTSGRLAAPIPSSPKSTSTMKGEIMSKHQSQSRRICNPPV